MTNTIIESLVPACRFGERGPYRDSEGNYFREFKDGLRAVPFVETDLRLTDFPLKTDIGVSYVLTVKAGIGGSGESLFFCAGFRKSTTKDGTKCCVFPLGDVSFDSEAGRRICRQLKLEQLQRSAPDSGAVRGIARDLPLELRWFRFYAEQGEYECRFDAGGFTFACLLKHSPHTNAWETDDTAIGHTRGERLSTAVRLGALLMARVCDEAHAENEWRDVQEYISCKRHREAVKRGEAVESSAGENPEIGGEGAVDPCR